MKRVSRRRFLYASGTAATALVLKGWTGNPPGSGQSTTALAVNVARGWDAVEINAVRLG